ncbi:unnamed protein product [Adineta steineri]|uniref:Dienelactone hydrolase domain-containing protein n=1 Tax=Adineta steineri TaxID=433720 RepID=A0A818SUD7_9BILA|nr:unnamed protein product [Adineta steineri]CAF3677609.1 unnamed protein product [Adineta steineri]
MAATERRANVRVHISKNVQQCNYPRGALIMVAGAGGGYTGPAAIYPDLAQEIIENPNIISVQMDYRFPGDLNPCIEDLIETIDILVSKYQIERVVLVGWSFGGAVVISAGAQHNLVKAIATVASQTAGTSSVNQLAPKGKACLFIHGTGDQCLPPRCSEQLYRLAGEPKELVLYNGDNHGVTNHRYEAKDKIKEFTLKYLCAPTK